MAHTETLIQPEIYVSAIGSGMENWPEGWDKISSGTDTIEITFKMKDENTKEFMEAMQQEASKVTDADCFDEWVRESHRLPDVKDMKLLRQLNVRGFGFGLQASGNYKALYFDFADGSSYEHGKVYN
jgi:hypothetical protein